MVLSGAFRTYTIEMKAGLAMGMWDNRSERRLPPWRPDKPTKVSKGRSKPSPWVTRVFKDSNPDQKANDKRTKQ
jgi:hypothetical protein